MSNPYEPPEDPAEPRPLVGLLWVALGAFFCTPLVGGALCAFNWRRAGRTRRAVGHVILGALGLALELALWVVGVGWLGIALRLGFAVFYGADYGMLRRAVGAAKVMHWVYPALLLVVVYVIIRSLPGALWVITGEDALRPDSMGPPPATAS